jgi:YesN/AraC family two-component response regulator
MARKTSLLIVDDSRSVIAQLEGMLKEFDAVEVVGSARDGAGAVRMVAEHSPDLVLMDIVMPGMDGLAALRIIAARHPEVAVAMLSSVGGRASLAEEAFRLGAIQVLGKPLEKAHLARLLSGLKRSED